MSTVSDIIGVGFLAGAGLVGYQIWKNRDAIGGFFGGIKSGFDDVTNALGDLGSKFQSAGEQTVKVVVDTSSAVKTTILDDTGITNPADPIPKQVIDANNTPGLTPVKVVQGGIENMVPDEVTDFIGDVGTNTLNNYDTSVGGLIAGAISTVYDKLTNKDDKSKDNSSSSSYFVSEPTIDNSGYDLQGYSSPVLLVNNGIKETASKYDSFSDYLKYYFSSRYN